MSDEFDDAEDEEEFDEGEDEGGEDDESPPKSGFGFKKLLLFVILPLVVLLGGGIGAAWFFGVFDTLFGEAEEVVAEGEEGFVRYFYEMDEFLVSMGVPGRKSGFMKLSISLELEKKTDEVRIKAVLPRIIDNFQIYLRGLKIEDLQGSHGLYRVREGLLARVNAATHPAKIKDVLFRGMVIQ
jgi:flagellar FliL protein|tara:strand:+ start:632 stop:1180 length:549 start_codon:yes stop_codon:yes gene_type:complete